MQITAIDGMTARCEAGGVQRDVSLFLLQDESIAVNDFVMVHVGYGIQKVEAEQARSAWESHDALQKLKERDDA